MNPHSLGAHADNATELTRTYSQRVLKQAAAQPRRPRK